MTAALKLISSMATRAVLTELCQTWSAATGQAVDCEAVGGVDAAKRVAAGEAVDLVVLARGALDQLVAGGSVRPGSCVDLVRSGVAAAVPAAEALPDLSTGDAVRAALRAARAIGYSTGPSGVQLLALFRAWGMADELAPRLKQARPGVPVGDMVASGEVTLGFQQLSELIHVQGIQLIQALPPEVAIETVFSAGIATTSDQAEAAHNLIAAMAAPEADAAKRRQGMTPA